MKTSIILAIALAFSGLVGTHAQTTAPAKPPTAEPKAPAALPEAKPADPDTIARLKIESARAAVSAGLYADAMKTLTEVFALKGISERNRTKSMAITADLCMRQQDWTLAKMSSERVINSFGADEEDRNFCKAVLKNLRKDHSKLFQSAAKPATGVDPKLTSADPEYGYSQKKPIKVGSTDEFGGPTAERAYLNTLRDEAGKPVTFERRGSFDGGPDGNMLDGYDVQTSTGRKALLYIDMYHPKNDPKEQLAPKGFFKAIDAGSR